MSPSDPTPLPDTEFLTGDEAKVNELERTRGSLNRERVANEKALALLVKDILALPEKNWEKLGVPEVTVDALKDARKIKSYGARARHARLIRSTLRDADWTLVRRRLDQFRAGYPLEATEGETSSPGQIWTEQLLVQGDAGLARFIEEYPDADRKRLRQLVRNTLRVPEAKRGKTRTQLERAVEIELARSASEDSAL